MSEYEDQHLHDAHANAIRSIFGQLTNLIEAMTILESRLAKIEGWIAEAGKDDTD